MSLPRAGAAPPARPLTIGLAFDLRADHEAGAGAEPGGDAPDDILEELDSVATIDALEGALASRGHAVRRMGGGRAFLQGLLEVAPDLVFNIAEGRGTRSREAHVPSACEMLGVPVTHSDPLTCALTLDKGLAKRVVAGEGVATPRWRVVHGLADLEGLDLRFPVIAKPAFEGSSIGIRRSSRSGTAADLRADVGRLLGDYRQSVLVEEFCTGPELTVGILGTGAGARVVGVLGIEPRHVPVAEFVYSVEVKREWESQVDYACPPRIDPAVLDATRRLALAAYRALGCRDVGRVDVRLDGEGHPQFIEVNPLPGLNPRTGDLVILSERSGLPYRDLVAGIVDEARARQGI